MLRFTAIGFLSVVLACFASAQNPPASDSQALSYAAQSIASMVGGASISDVTLSGNVIWNGTDTGTATLYAKGVGQSRVDVTTSDGTRSDVRNDTSGLAAGMWTKNGVTPTAYARHNCWTNAAWFLPALSSLSQTSNPNFIFRYIGPEQHQGINTQHIQTYQIATRGLRQLQHLSTMDVYLHATSYLPVAVAFNTHPDDDLNTDIAIEIRFDGYQAVGGIQVPFHLQRVLNGGVVMDVTVTNAVVNAGLPDSLFSLQ